MISEDKRNEVYLNNKYKEFTEGYGMENINRYSDFYEEIPTTLQRVFSFFHFEFNRLLKHLNNRLSNGHYNAQESRDMIYLFNEIKNIQSNLKGTDLDFELNQYYEDRLKECESFLQDSGGSPIPIDFEKIDIKEIEPIFNLRTSVSVPSIVGTTLYPIEKIGEGSYATVHKYRDEYYNCDFVIKKASNDLNDKEYERFRIEFEEMKKLNSPYVIEVYKYDEENHQYIMEYADETLGSLITNNPKLSVSDRVGLVRQILQAFIYINCKGVLHRDISIKNVLIKKYDGLNIIKISDFGLVKRVDSTLTSKNTEFKGSLNDPKLEVLGFGNYEIRHETYALTRLIYFVMAGRTTLGTFENSEFELFVHKGMADNINERYSSIEELRQSFSKVVKALH